MAKATFGEFMATYDPDGTRVAFFIEPRRDPDGNSPFIVVRHGEFTAVLALMPMGDHLCIDVHPFVSGQDAAAGVFGMTDGRRYTGFGETGETSHGWPATRGVSVLVGEQAAVRSLNWYTSVSADADNHDQEVDLAAIGCPGGASWASVSPSHGDQWWWVIYDRWLDVDEEPSPVLAEGHVAGEAAAKLAVETWVRTMQGSQQGSTSVAGALSAVDAASREVSRVRDAGEDDDAAGDAYLDALERLAETIRRES